MALNPVPDADSVVPETGTVTAALVPTAVGDVVISHSKASRSMYSVWTVTAAGDQTPSPLTHVSCAMGVAASVQLARMLAADSGGAIYALDPETRAWNEVARTPDMGQPAAARAAAVTLVQQISDRQGEPAHGDTEMLVSAIAADLATASADATDAEVRLAKVETQTRVLSEAVMAMTDAPAALAPAVKAVKDEM